MVAGGSSAQQIAHAAGVQIGQKAAMQAIKKVPIAIILQLNERAGFMLIAKYGTKRPVITLAKGVPVVESAVGGSVDATMTALVGRAANSMFRQDGDDD